MLKRTRIFMQALFCKAHYYQLLTTFITFVLLSSFASKTAQSQVIKDQYDRIGLTVVYLTYGNQYTDRIEEAIKQIELPEKFYDNSLDTYIINAPRSMAYIGAEMGPEQKEERIETVKEFFESNHIARKIVGKWYNYQPDKGFDLSAIFERAEYNATDEEIMVSETSKRGQAMIRDYGHKLVSNSYVAVVDLRAVERDLEKEDTYTSINYSADMGLYVFKLQFGDQEINNLFNTWVYPDDDPETVEEKTRAFENMHFPLNHIFTKADWIMLSGGHTHTALDKLKGESLNMDTLDQLAFTEMMTDSYQKILFHASKEIESFKVKTKVMDTRPVKAKIGKKESVRTDDQFFIYEYVYNERKDTILPKRRAVVRAKRVADNRGEKRSEKSSFYQTYGRTVREGMLLRQKPSFGISILGNYESAGLGGVGFRGMYRISRFFSIPALYLIADIAVAGEDYGDSRFRNYSYIGDRENMGFFRYTGGLGKGFQLLRFIEITPFFTLGLESTGSYELPGESEEKSYSTLITKTGVTGGINILHNFQVYGQYNLYSTGTVMVFDEEGEIIEDAGGEEWAEAFPGREGGAGIEFGIRYEF